MKILVTGFDPFNNETVNPAYEAVKLLPDQIQEAEIIKLEIPTSFQRSAVLLEETIQTYQPDVVLSIGQAGGRNEITIEQVAINMLEARIADNDGYQPCNLPIKEDGENAYFTNLNAKGIVQYLIEHNIPASISYTAGTFVCNCVMYHNLYLVDKKYPNMKAGFIHVPYLPQQACLKKPVPSSMSLETIAKAIELAIEAIVLRQESTEIFGETH